MICSELCAAVSAERAALFYGSAARGAELSGFRCLLSCPFDRFRSLELLFGLYDGLFNGLLYGRYRLFNGLLYGGLIRSLIGLRGLTVGLTVRLLRSAVRRNVSWSAVRIELGLFCFL